MKPRSIFMLAIAAAMTATAQTSGYDAALKAFGNYDFDLAEELLDKYASKRKRDQIAADRMENPYRAGETIDRVDNLRSRINLGRNMLERVEKLEIVDTLIVDRYDFFRHFRLNPSSGRLADSMTIDGVPSDVADTALDPVYVTEDGSTMMWVSADDDEKAPAGRFTMMEATRLADGSWEEPHKLFTRAEVFADDNDGQLYSPYLMADGMTLYFAADGEQSLGGLDIFIARRESTGEFLQPSNIGMPYNSPANDFMMAIDEATGAGWWATDRNTDEEHVTIYVFKPTELRVNIDSDTDDLAAQAMLKEFSLADTATREEIKKLIDTIQTTSEKESSFSFAMPDGRVITRMNDLRSPDARELLADWLHKKQTIAADTEHLQSLRMARRNGNRSADTEIMNLERLIEADKASLKRLANDIIRSENR